MKDINITQHDFHEERNYTIHASMPEKLFRSFYCCECPCDLIWFAVVVTALSMVAVVLHRWELTLTLLKVLPKNVSLTTIFQGVLPFFIPFAVGIALIVAFP